MKGKSGIMRKFKWSESYKEEVDEDEKMWNNVKMFEKAICLPVISQASQIYIIHTDIYLYKHINWSTQEIVSYVIREEY